MSSHISEHVVIGKALAAHSEQERTDPIYPDAIKIRLQLTTAQIQRLTAATERCKMSRQLFIAEAIETYISYNGVGVTDDAPEPRPEPARKPTKPAKRSEAYYMGLRSALSRSRGQEKQPESAGWQE